ncbi:glycoside hydrolase family 88 protein [Alteromonadaceae bacterium BrNp21-10]|nr:glycoside hydrolase family 88 protein [Alteromonadaceae bacterium BrNp21-10]
MKKIILTIASLCILWSGASFATQADKQVIAIANTVADWQLQHRDSVDYIRTYKDQTGLTKGWVQAAFYVGLTRWAHVTNNANYQQVLLQLAESNKWQLGPLTWHADDHAIGQIYLALPQGRLPKHYEPTQAVFDGIINYNASNSLEFLSNPDPQSEGTCQRRWCWSDALFMAPPVWAALSKVTGDEKYLNFGLKEYAATQDYLYDKELHLFYRDSRFFEKRSEHGNKIFWSRGNGWVFAGIPLLLEQMPESHPARATLLTLYTEMAARFKAIQTDAGLWASSLMDFEHQPLKETSGSAFVTFGISWGINQGILDKTEYLPVVQKAWPALVSAVDKDGKLGWVQQIGNAPDQVLASDTQYYGVGAFLLAASEMMVLE